MKNEIVTKHMGLEHPTVQKVLQIAEDIMSENKTLDIESLYNLAKKTLKIPRKGLLKIIQFLLNKKVLIEGSKFSKETVLLNQHRKNIYHFIYKQGATHFSNIKKNVFLDNGVNVGSSGQLIWHLEMLLKFQYIKKMKVGNYTVFLPIAMDEETGIITFLLKDKLSYKILVLLNEVDQIERANIYKKINEQRESVYYRINNLIENELISVSERNDKLLLINADKKKVINEILKNVLSKQKRIKF